jgi:ankyrin repeat protein
MGTRKNKKSKKSNKRFRKTRSKRQRGGGKNDKLIEASWFGRTEIVEKLLNEGANVHAKDEDGYTALMMASENGHTEIVEKLLEGGANVDEKHDNGNTALIYATVSSRPETVAMLLTWGADVNMRYGITGTPFMFTNDGYTPLMLASECYINMDLPAYQFEYEMQYKKRIVEMLLNHPNIDVNAKNNNDDTALDIAIDTECSPEIIKLLKQHIVAQPIPKHLETQRKRKKDRQNLHMLMRAKGVHSDLERFTGYYLGGKRKTRKQKSKKSKKN